MKKISFKNIKIDPIYLKTIILLIPILEVLFNFGVDNDFWFTINQGRYVLNNGFPNQVIGTIHEGLSFIYQSYGTGVLFYLIYKTTGLIGIMSLTIILAELINYFFYKLCYTISNNKTCSYIITILFAISLSLFFLVTRPQIFTYLNLTIILYLLEKYIKEDKIKYLIPIPIIGLLQVNMHGIYLLPLLIIICPYIINSFKFKIFKIESNGYHKKPLIITYLLTFLVSFINPYTYKTVLYGFTSYNNVMKKIIIELQSPNFHLLTGKIIIGTMIICLMVYYLKKKKLPLRYYLLIAGTTYMTLDAIKSTPFFLICSFFPIAYLYKKGKDNDYLVTKKQIIINATIVIITLIIATLNIIYVDNHKLDNVVNYLKENNTIDNPKLYTSFWNGSYMEYMGYNCYIDPRAEVFLKINNKKEDILVEFDNLQNSTKINYLEFLDKYQFDYLLIETKKDALYYYLRYYPNDNYEKVYDEELFEIWKKVTK